MLEFELEVKASVSELKHDIENVLARLPKATNALKILPTKIG